MQHENPQAGTQVENPGTVNCPSCGASLVAGLRFCRMCGYRLGEGVEEFVATQRLNPDVTTATQAARATDPFVAHSAWNAAPPQAFGTNSLNMRDSTGVRSWASACNARRGGWMTWTIIIIVLMTAFGAATKSVRNRVAGGSASVLASKSFLGVDGLERAQGGGAFIVGIAAPDTPVMRAGLIGGDVIKSFDGKPVADDEALRRILAETPVGKTVLVEYVRDGTQGSVYLTTMSDRDNPGLKAFDRRPGGRGKIEIDAGDLERVGVPGSNIYGVQLGDIDMNGPADVAGLKKGDIITEFNGYPTRTAGDLRYRIAEALPGSTVKVVLVRGTEPTEIMLKIGKSKN